MSKQIKDTHVDLVHKLDNMPARNFQTLIPNCDEYKNYQQDIREAADLISKMLKWIPKDQLPRCLEAQLFARCVDSLSVCYIINVSITNQSISILATKK